MPEYLAPGVFVEEVSFRQKSIEGVSTSTTGFVGPTRFGPSDGEPALLTSFSEFERIYGGLDQLRLGGTDVHNDVAHAVRVYFDEGGKRLYVARVYNPTAGSDGHAHWEQDDSPPPGFSLRARYPGRDGNRSVTFRFRMSENVLTTEPRDPGDPEGSQQIPVLRGAANHDVVLAMEMGSPEERTLYRLERFSDPATGRDSFRLWSADATVMADTVSLDEVSEVRVLTVSVIVGAVGRFGEEQTWEDLALHPQHRRALGSVFEGPPVAQRATELYVPLIFETDLTDGAAIAETLLDQQNLAGSGTVLEALLADAGASESARSFRVDLTGGSDGDRPNPADYRGHEDGGFKSGLRALEDLEDISIIAAPGATRQTDVNGAQAVMTTLITHCERMRYRVAVLDTPENQLPGQARELRGRIDSTRAALYYPWVRIFDPVTETQILQPPSGFMAGIYARNDVERGVHKAPANEVVRSALGFEFLINTAQQEALNPEGINCLRFFEGRGYRVWGARTVSSDAEWKYLNVRRYFAFLERSIEKGTQFAVFEPNGPVLWANVQRTISDFLFNEWASNHLLGTKPEEAFFVRCDRTTMTQNDLDNGRLICLVGVAPLRPAEFVIFRIGQKTADARS